VRGGGFPIAYFVIAKKDPGSICQWIARTKGQGETARTITVAFPITLDAFNHRQVLAAVISPYDQTVPVVLGK
jgi:hypothetical protein